MRRGKQTADISVRVTRHADARMLGLGWCNLMKTLLALGACLDHIGTK
ncbi:hypothetical protein BSIN_2731 [Burkholderia singularis]|uniref:Uncharacterized protein n=1 Tax=Burkholderia singularis TaxID=1503053 RepID=A0A238H0X7_9BURK|nr:hypothetical protein BSIN_2731 [Burkholderia singularis]